MNPTSRAPIGAQSRVALVNISPWYQDGQAATIQRTGRFDVTQRITLDHSAPDILLQQQPEIIFVSVPVARPDWLDILMKIRFACPWSYVVAATAEPNWRSGDRFQHEGTDCLLIYPLTDGMLIAALDDGVQALFDRADADPVYRVILSLSPTLRRVASVLSTGASNPAIATALCLSRNTVERHISALFRAFDVSSRVPLGTMLACCRRGPRLTGPFEANYVTDPASYEHVH